jgi:hypothetical protein
MDISYPAMIAACLLAMAYVVGGPLDAHATARGVWARRRWVSAAAGVSVAYVFVDLLPELAEQNRAILHAAGNAPLLFAEQRVYILTLFSFVVFYGLQYVVLASTAEAGQAAEPGGNRLLYLVHVCGFSLYSALIGYLLVERAEHPLALCLYTFAMTLHFLIVDHSLAEQHGERYRRVGRWVLAGSVLVGWLVGDIAPLSEVNFARLFALLAGGVVITSLRGELPDKERGRFWPFCLGALLYAGVLLFV